jgi:sulfhydrogenase subunit alpha
MKNIRELVLRGIKVFYSQNGKLIRNSDYLCLRNEERYDFLEGNIVNSSGKKVPEKDFHNFMRSVIIPYSQAEGYIFSDTHDDYFVGSLARINFNKDLLNQSTKEDVAFYLNVFPSNNIYHNNLAQAIEILQCVDEAIEIINNITIKDEKPIAKQYIAGEGVGVIEAPRGTLYHSVKINEKGIIEDYDVIVPTAQNQINIENDLRKYFNENIEKNEETLKLDAEKIIRAYDPCMSCATNFLKIKWIRS